MIRSLIFAIALAVLPGGHAAAQQTAGNAPSGAATTADPLTVGVVIRVADLRSAPEMAAAVVASLPVDTRVTVVARKGLWMQVFTPAPRKEGWVRFTEVRLGGSGAAAAGGARTGVAGVSRSISSFFNRGRGSNQAANRSATSTIGVRGITKADLAQTTPDAAALEVMENYQEKNSTVRKYATDAGLMAREVAYVDLDKPAATENPR